MAVAVVVRATYFDRLFVGDYLWLFVAVAFVAIALASFRSPLAPAYVD